MYAFIDKITNAMVAAVKSGSVHLKMMCCLVRLSCTVKRRPCTNAP